MKDQDFTRIRNAVSGYWPAYTFTPQAIKAWRQQLSPFPVEEILDALADYSAGGNLYPPIAGQLAAQISPPSNRHTKTETEPDRCKRQMSEYLELMNGPNGSNTSRTDFDWYWRTYWSRHLPESAYPFAIDTPNQSQAAA
mgnify:CR=1 FL=1